jgi:hypothetical protein
MLELFHFNGIIMFFLLLKIYLTILNPSLLILDTWG